MPEAQFKIRMMYKTELARLYGITLYSLNRMLELTSAAQKRFGNYKGRVLLTTRQITLFIEHNGEP